MTVKYYVVSFPRSVTNSICKMSKICGLSVSHASVHSLKSKSLSKNKESVFSIIKKNNRPLLEYFFSDGWKPFCDFLEVTTPNIDITVLNKNKMFDQI